MKLAPLLLSAALAAISVSARAGTIDGTVFNTSTGKPVPCQVTITLQVLVKDQFVPFRDSISDQEGHFRFTGLPVEGGVVYQPGATRHGVFYPGPRIRLTGLNPLASAELSVCDASASPCPLVLKKMDVTIRPETGILRVSESLLIDNPTHTCYVGQAVHGAAEPLTLELSIPPEFERTTFDQEFFGRRFAVANNRVATNVPWPPGERELKYTYVLRNTQKVLVWKRPVDLPCSKVTIRVEGKASEEVHCAALRQAQSGPNAIVFESGGEPIPAGQVLQVEIGRLPLPWMTYGKWAALAIMLVLIGGTGWWHLRRRGRTSLPAASPKTLTAQSKRKRAA
jgi:hypothetical protein